MTKPSDSVIRFQAQVSKVTTLSDGGIRLVLDIPETEIQTATRMMEAKQAGAILEIAAVPTVKRNGRKPRKTEITENAGATY